jgi:di/tricarboxylate transporter
MSGPAWISILVTLAVFATMLLRRGAPTDLLFLGGLVGVTVLGVISPAEALSGFANEAVITIAALFVVAAGLRSTGVLDQVGNWLLGTARTARAATVRLTLALEAISAVILNTAVVAMFVPVVLDWCRQRGVSPSRVLIPVSYMAILGGTCTLIGTSTNIIVNGLLRDEYQNEQQRIEAGEARYEPDPEAFRAKLEGMTLWEIGKVGFPCAVLGGLYLVFFGRRMLADRSALVEQLDEQRREYLVEMLVRPDCRLIGKTVEAAGLRHLRGLFLVEIDRQGDAITPVTPNDTIHAGDRLIFTGVVSTIVDLEKIPGLVPAADMTYEFLPHRRQLRHLSEAVLSPSSPLIGRTVRQANFRERYNAAVVAVHRNGARLPSKVGEITLRPGDTLLLQTRTGFTDRFRDSRDFCLVSDVEGSEARRHHRAWLAALLLVVLVIWLVATSLIGQQVRQEGLPAGLGSTAVAGLAIAGLMIVGRCLPLAEARSVIDLRVLVTIAAALGLGTALRESGAAKSIAESLVTIVGETNPYTLLAVLYLLTVVFTETITNNAVAVMLFPIAVETAAVSGYSPRPFVMAIALAASLSFLTPIGYQTNLMVMGPGGYQPRDYLRAGWPLALLMAVTAMTLIPIIWPFAL